jgi:hypothetical protein
MNAVGTRLTATTRELWARWCETRSQWRDEKSQEFEEKYLADLVSAVEKSVAAIEQVDKLLLKIRKDCE